MDFFQLEIMQVRAYAESRPTVPTHTSMRWRAPYKTKLCPPRTSRPKRTQLAEKSFLP